MQNTLLQSGLNNSALAAAETWELKGCMLKVKGECGHFILFRWLSRAPKSVFLLVKVQLLFPFIAVLQHVVEFGWGLIVCVCHVHHKLVDCSNYTWLCAGSLPHCRLQKARYHTFLHSCRDSKIAKH